MSYAVILKLQSFRGLLCDLLPRDPYFHFPSGRFSKGRFARDVLRHETSNGDRYVSVSDLLHLSTPFGEFRVLLTAELFSPKACGEDETAFDIASSLEVALKEEILSEVRHLR